MDRRAAKGAVPRQLALSGRIVEYSFARGRRRTLGITVDADGLAVAAPLRMPWRDIEAFLRDKERWIIRKLDEWALMPRPTVLRGASGESLPLFGSAVTLEVNAGRRAVRCEPGRLLVSAPAPQRTLKVLLGWLKTQALDALTPRAAHYAERGRAAGNAVECAHAVGRVQRGRIDPPQLAPGASRAGARRLRRGALATATTASTAVPSSRSPTTTASSGTISALASVTSRSKCPISRKPASG